MAAAGYGKTTALRTWFPQAATQWLSGAEMGGLIDDELRRLTANVATVNAAGRTLTVVIDEVPRLTDAVADQLLSVISELPGEVTVALSSRWPLGASGARWHGRGLLTEIRPGELALSPAQVAEVLANVYELRDADLAEQVHAITAGWPALVHLAAETLMSTGIPRGPLLPTLTEPGSLIASYLTDEVLNPLPAEVARLVRDISELSPVSAGLGQALGHRTSSAAMRLLSRTGLVVSVGDELSTGECLVPAVAEVARQGRRRDAARTVAALAAPWYDEHGPAAAAARAFRQAGDQEQCVRVLDESGDLMLAGGESAALAELLTDVPEALRTRRLRLLLGDALRTIGDVAGAAATYGMVADREPDWDAGLAWRVGLVHYLRGDSGAALEAFGKGQRDQSPAADVALLLAWTATALMQIGDASTAIEYAREAHRCATEAQHDVALATAHISLALCLGIAGNPADSDEHYVLALRIAERTSDLVLLTRILTNQTYHLLCEGRYPDALDAAKRATQCAKVAGHTNLRVIAGCNEADALTMLGRYDEAVAQYEYVLAQCRRMGSRRSASALLGLGEVHRRRGWREQARAAYEEAIRVSDEAGHRQVSVCALAGLALAVMADDPKSAAAHANLAVERAADKVTVPALLARGWVSLHIGDRSSAAADATDAAREARAHRDRAGLAESLELRAATETHPVRARATLHEAYAIWTDTGAVVDAARTLVAIGALPHASTDDRLGALLAAETLAAAGVSPGDMRRPDLPHDVSPTEERPPRGQVVIKALGRFEVHIDDQLVPAAQWQSRKARDLLRILVARRGRPVPRPELCELLWPDDDPAKTGHRLSVLLSIVRGILDPYRLVAADHYVVADQACIALDITRLRIDVEDFLNDVAHGRRLSERGALPQARTLLTAAERGYRGDAFEDEPYTDWSGPLREEARAAYFDALRILAQASRSVGETGTAVGYLLRLLEKDPYDEAGHRALVETLVAGGQHGEARRAYLRYGEAMRTIGVREPDDVVLRPRPTKAFPVGQG